MSIDPSDTHVQSSADVDIAKERRNVIEIYSTQWFRYRQERRTERIVAAVMIAGILTPLLIGFYTDDGRWLWLYALLIFFMA